MDQTRLTDRWLLDQMAQITLILDRDRRIVAMNRSAQRFFGVEEAEARGRRCREVTSFALCDGRCPFEEAVACGQTRKVLDLESHRGAICVNITPLTDGNGEIVGAVESIQEADLVKELADRLERKQARLSAEMEKSRTVVNSIADGIYTVDLGMRITAFSRNAEKMTGYREDEVLGKSCREVLNASVCETDCPLQWTLRHGRPVQNCSAVLVGKGGGRIPAFVSSDLLRDPAGEVCGCIGIIRDRSEVEALKAKLHGQYSSDFICKSKAMLDVFDRVHAVAATDSTVLLQGESGTGKEVVARSIHYHSGRKSGPFIKVNCASLAENLLESELFGHEKGAFTGALRDKPGRFELADGGTIFLDEIGDTSLALQAKLLRVLQEKEYERVGGIRTLKTDVRVLAATNKDLRREIERGTFREDLYYRLCVVPIHLPPLRERKEDIPLLVENFIEKFNARGKRISEVSSRAMALLIDYDWPGNVRELENAIEHAFVTSTTGRIERQFLPPTLLRRGDLAKPHPPGGEHEQILRALEKHRWAKDEAAKELGMSRTTLWRKLKKMGMM